MIRRARLLDKDVIFYLASTVAQTLAGLAGFLGAFVLFRVQRLDTSITATGDKLAEIVGNHAARYDLLADDLDAYLNRMSPFTQPANIHADRTTAGLDKIGRMRAARTATLYAFKRSMFSTGPVLLFSLVVIWFAPWIASCAVGAYAACAVLIGGFSGCGWLYWKVVSGSLELR